MTPATQSLARVRDFGVDLDLTVEELREVGAPDSPASAPASTERDFDRLYEEFSPRVRGLVKKLIVDAGQAEDLVQETFFRAYNAGLHFEYERAHPEHTQWPWLAAVARNLSLDVLRRHKGVTEEEFVLEEFTREAPGAEPDLHLLATRRREAIRDALNSVSDRHRRVLFMKCVEGKTYDEIAESEGISVDALKSVLARARRTFRTSYAMLAERRGLGAVLGGAWLRTMPARLRSWRDRFVAGFDGRMSEFMTAAGPATANAIATVAVAIAAAVVGAALASGSSVAGAGELVSDARPAPRVLVAADAHADVVAPAVEAAAEVVVTAPGPAVAIVAPAPAPAASVASPPTPAEAAGGGGGGTSTKVDTDEIVPVEDPPAGAQAGVNTSVEDGRYKDIDERAGVDTDGDGNTDGGLENDTDIPCSEEDRKKSVTLRTTCLVLDTAENPESLTAGP